MDQTPQLENGYTRIANEIIESLAKVNFNGTQRRIIDVVLRQTYGYQRKGHYLSNSFIAEATNIHKKQIQRELNALIEKNVIIVMEEATFKKSRKIKFNKDYRGWLISSEVADKLPHSENDTYTGSGLVPRTGSELVPQKKKKENIKESDSPKNDFKGVYDYYLTLDLIKHRTYKPEMTTAMKKAMQQLNCDTEHLKVLLKRHKEKVEATKDKGEFAIKPRGITEFFGQKKYGGSQLICSDYDDDVYKASNQKLDDIDAELKRIMGGD